MRPSDPFDAIPRNKGNFLWKQLAGAIESGANMIYVAMFDEIDEGTAIFKCAHEVPVGPSKFVNKNNCIATTNSKLSRLKLHLFNLNSVSFSFINYSFLRRRTT